MSEQWDAWILRRDGIIVYAVVIDHPAKWPTHQLNSRRKSGIIRLQPSSAGLGDNPVSVLLACGGLDPMTEFRPELVTGILNALEGGEPQVSDELLPVLYQELHKLAYSLMAQFPPGVTLQPTALVHEAYLRIGPGMSPGWNGRGHFFGAAARAMRQILVEQARRKATPKHGGNLQKMNVDPDLIPFDNGDVDILALDQALDELATVNERQLQVIQLRYFTGLSIPETAQTLGISESTVERDWRFARVFLRYRLNEAGGHGI